METIKLDLIPGKKMPSLHASQYDDGREHGIDLFENGVVYKLDGTETLTINERKGDDCICSLDIENTFADSNHIVFASTEQMCAVWGNNICELVIKRGNVTLGTLNFILEIEPSPTEGGIESESEISNLERQITEITEQVIGDDYYTAEETDEAIATAIEGKADTTYVDTELAKKADKSNTYTKSEVDTLIDNLPEPMIFKGTLGVGGTIQTLPTASASNEGYTYKVITDGTYAGQTAKVGDVFTSNGSAWVLIPSGDEDNDTWRAIKVEGVEVLGNGTSSGAVDFVGSDNIEIEYDGDGKIKTKTKNIYTKEQVDDIVYNILPDDTASGSVANFNTSLELPIKSLKIDVNAVQDLHGYDYPWIAGGGKNVYPPITPDTKNGITLTNDNGVITLNGTATADAYFDIDNLNIALPTGSKLYLCAFNPITDISRLTLFLITNNMGNPQVNLNNTNAMLETTIASEDSVGTRLRLRVPNGFTYSNYKLSPYLQIGGSAPTLFTPYENICPIEGWDAITPNVNGTTEVINLGGTYYGGHFTQDKAGHRQFVATHSELLDMGNLEWRGFDISNNIFRVIVPNCKEPVDTSDRKNGFLCSIYPPSTTTSINANMTDKSMLRFGGYLVLRDTSFSDYTEIASAVRGQKLIYELATPIVIDLPDGEPIITLNGTNNIYADTGNTSVVFKDSVNGYVEKKIASVQALILNG